MTFLWKFIGMFIHLSQRGNAKNCRGGFSRQVKPLFELLFLDFSLLPKLIRAVSAVCNEC